LIEEADLPTVWLFDGKVLAILSEDFGDSDPLFACESFSQGILKDVSSVVKPSDVFSELVVVVPASDYAIVVADDVRNWLVDEGIYTVRLTVGHVSLQFL
jgi:hypothetical protein